MTVQPEDNGADLDVRVDLATGLSPTGVVSPNPSMEETPVLRGCKHKAVSQDEQVSKHR